MCIAVILLQECILTEGCKTEVIIKGYRKKRGDHREPRRAQKSSGELRRAQESPGELKVKTGSCPRSTEGTKGQQGSKLNFKMVAIKKNWVTMPMCIWES